MAPSTRFPSCILLPHLPNAANSGPDIPLLLFLIEAPGGLATYQAGVAKWPDFTPNKTVETLQVLPGKGHEGPQDYSTTHCKLPVFFSFEQPTGL